MSIHQSYADPDVNDPTSAHYRDPWCQFIRDLRDAFEGIPTDDSAARYFPGKNLMADEIVSYHRAGDQRFEVSYGRFMEHYGTALTFRNALRPDDSGSVELFDTPALAAARLREVMA